MPNPILVYDSTFIPDQAQDRVNGAMGWDLPTAGARTCLWLIPGYVHPWACASDRLTVSGVLRVIDGATNGQGFRVDSSIYNCPDYNINMVRYYGIPYDSVQIDVEGLSPPSGLTETQWMTTICSGVYVAHPTLNFTNATPDPFGTSWNDAPFKAETFDAEAQAVACSASVDAERSWSRFLWAITYGNYFGDPVDDVAHLRLYERRCQVSKILFPDKLALIEVAGNRTTSGEPQLDNATMLRFVQMCKDSQYIDGVIVWGKRSKASDMLYSLLQPPSVPYGPIDRSRPTNSTFVRFRSPNEAATGRKSVYGIQNIRQEHISDYNDLGIPTVASGTPYSLGTDTSLSRGNVSYTTSQAPKNKHF